MRPENRDAAHLWDMLEYARLAREITHDVTFDAYARDRIKQLALERAVEVIGEAARRVSESFRAAHPEIPWRNIIANRNVLAHEYDEIYQELLWRTATESVTALIDCLSGFLQPDL